MQYETKEVKSKQQVVGEARYPQFDSVQEAIEHEGEANCLDFINAQVRTNELNRVRAAHGGRPTKKQLINEALASLSLEEFQSVAGDQAALQVLIDKKVRELEKQKGLDNDEEEED